MEKEAVSKALQEAVNDYNIWNKEQGEFVNHSWNERRGIFYNKLLARLRLVAGFYDINKDLYGRLLEPDDFRLSFKINGHIENLGIAMYAKGQFYTTTKHKFLLLLRGLVQPIVYETLPDNSYYELASIVERIKAFKI
jgi:hypothetical protein